MFRYVIEPTDPANAAQVAHTEALLQNVDSSAEIVAKKAPEGTSLWLLRSKNAELEDFLRAIEGVGYAEQEVISAPVRRNVMKYAASAVESSNIEKTEEFLKSKVQDGSEVHRQLDDHGTVVGWDRLALDQDAARLVEEYEGIEYPLGIQDYKKN
jgi:hypothetical protein